MQSFLVNLAFLIIIPLFSVVAQAQTVGDETHQSQPEIWNAATVDWRVSMDDRSANNREHQCEVNWLYDNVYSLSLIVNGQGRMYFAFQVTGEQAPNVNFLEMARNGTNISIVLMGNGKTEPVRIADTSPSRLTTILEYRHDTLDRINEIEHFLLKIDNFIYNFPLENIEDNLAYFSECLDTLNLHPVSSHSPAVNANYSHSDTAKRAGHETQTMTQPQPPGFSPFLTRADDQSPAYGQGPRLTRPEYRQEPEQDVEVQPYSEVLLSEPPQDVEVQSYSEALLSEPPQDNEIIPATPVFEKPVKQKDAEWQEEDYLGERAQVDNDTPKTRISDTGRGLEYDVSEQGSSIIRNLTRKLSILEKEKEQLRGRLSKLSKNDQLREILTCSDQMAMPEQPDFSINDELVTKFEATIENLRAENELLREAMLNSENNDDTEITIEDEDIEETTDEDSDPVTDNDSI